MTGILNINKPKGFTSSDVVVILKKILGQKRIGHLGTLDPLASGVLPVCIGKATRLFDFYLNKNKTYIATFCFGKLTDTLDSEGKFLQENGVIPTKEAILKALPAFLGLTEQYPPKYSAKNIGGTRAYKLARSGVDFELKPKLVNIIKFELVKQINEAVFEFEIECGSGTYIRSLGRDLAEKLNTVAIMTDLVRTQCGEFKLNKSVEIKDKNKDILIKNIMPLKEVLKNLKTVDLNDEQYFKLIHGIAVNFDVCEENLLLLYNKEVIGIGSVNENYLKIKTYLKEDL